MKQENPKRLFMVIGLVVVAGGVLAYSLTQASKDPATPTAAVEAGAFPTKLEDDVSVTPYHGGGHK